jgi:hypothetical protein
MALARCILGKFLGVGCHCFPPPLDVATFSARCLQVQRFERPLVAEGGTLRGREMFRQISSRVRLPRNSRDLLPCRKSATWDRRLYFPSEGRRAEEFFALKNPTATAGFKPANLGTKGQHATSWPSKPTPAFNVGIINSITRLHLFDYFYCFKLVCCVELNVANYNMFWDHLEFWKNAFVL